MDFLEDPRLRQRWNQISHTTGEVTENAAAGIWSFQHHYLNPCLASLGNAIDACAAPCLGDLEERARRRREADRRAAEYSFDFYDDWYADDGLLGNSGDDSTALAGAGAGDGGWSIADWDRLLAGTGAQRRHGGADGEGVQQEQPKRKRGMSYGTRGAGRRKASGELDPTIIPSTQPIGFLSKLPWKMGKTLRYKPSAADLQDHPGQHEVLGMGEAEPLLDEGSEGSEYDGQAYQPERTVAAGRKRSGTTGSGDTSDSYRSRGDLFPSDGEGEEDAVPLDDEFSMVLSRVNTGDDRSSGRTRRSSKGKRPVSGMSRTVSRATIDSIRTRASTPGPRHSSGSTPVTPELNRVQSMEDLQREEDQMREEEDAEVEAKRRRALALAIEKGLRGVSEANEAVKEVKSTVSDEADVPEPTASKGGEQQTSSVDDDGPLSGGRPPGGFLTITDGGQLGGEEFVPARLPRFR
ncbi:hypothetical protein BN1708_012213, partial [Verticillium longisporum]